jgi:hypothetical protein
MVSSADTDSDDSDFQPAEGGGGKQTGRAQKTKEKVGGKSGKKKDAENTKATKNKGKGGKTNKAVDKDATKDDSESESTLSEHEDPPVAKRRPKPRTKKEWDEYARIQREEKKKRREEEDDPDYEDQEVDEYKVAGKKSNKVVDTSMAEEEREEDGYNYNGIKKQRNRAKVTDVVDNGCMEEDVDGKVAISRFAFSAEKEVLYESVIQLLGSRALQLSDAMKYEVFKWYKQLKVNAVGFCKERVLQEVLRNAEREKMPFSTLYFGGYANCMGGSY